MVFRSVTSVKAFEILWDVLIIGVPPVCVSWAWHKRIRPMRTWREYVLGFALVATTMNLVLYLSLWCLPGWFGAKLGAGLGQWERTCALIASGFSLSVAAFLLAAIGSGKPTKKLLLVLSLAGAVFWTIAAIPANDFLAGERAQQHAIHAVR